jgi:hypothetical protein
VERYTPSNRFGPLAIPGLVVAAVAAAALAWGYQFAVDWIPLIYVEFLATIGFGFVLGYLVRELVVRGKIRSPGLALGVLGVVVLVGWAASFRWAYERALSQAYDEVVKDSDVDPKPTRAELAEAVPFGKYIDLRLEEGWSVGTVASRGANRPTVSGVLVYLVWLLELGILGFYGWKKLGSAAATPFCEGCGTWTQPTEHAPALGGLGSDVADAADAGDLRRVLTPRTTPGASRALGYVVHACPSCDTSAWLDVTSEEVATKGNKQVVVSRPVVRALELRPGQAAEVAATRKAHAEAVTAERKAQREAKAAEGHRKDPT